MFIIVTYVVTYELCFPRPVTFYSYDTHISLYSLLMCVYVGIICVITFVF